MSSRPKNNGTPTTPPGAGFDEIGVDTRRYLAALRRGRYLIVAIAATVTVLVVVISLATEKKYAANATIVVSVPVVDPTGEPPDIERLLPTFAETIVKTPTLDEAANRVDLRNADALVDKVDASADPTKNLLEVFARDPTPRFAAEIADAVAESFVDGQEELARAEADEVIARLRETAAALDPASPEAQTIADQILALKTSPGVISLQVIGADVPESPASPKPLRNGILAFFFALLIAVLIALARDQLRPLVADPRELSRLSRMQVLAGIPLVSGRGRRRHHEAAIEHEAYQSLGAAVQIALPASGQHVIMVTSALHGEGKTTATARLGRVLAEAGHNTLLISGDLRWPALHEAFGLPIEPGLSDVLELVKRAGLSRHILPASVSSVPMARDSSGRTRSLDVLTSGRKVRDPATLLSDEALGAFLDHVRSFPYSYVLIDGPPMLGIADGQAIAQRVDRVVMVSRLDRLTVENVADMRDLLDRLEAAPLGHVVIGARVEVTPYYQSERAREVGYARGGGDPGSGGAWSVPAGPGAVTYPGGPGPADRV